MTIGYYAIDTRELNYALKDRQFLLSLQPIINIEEESFETLEVFIRWKHPLLGMLPPSLFMPRMNSPELQHAMTDYIIQEAVEICRNSEAMGKPVGVNININPNEFHHPDTLRVVRRETFELEDPSNICFELNPKILTKYCETVGIENYYPDQPPSEKEILYLQTVKTTLDAYKNLGVTIILDTYDHLFGAIERAKFLGLHAIKISPKVIASAPLDEKKYLQKAMQKAKESHIALIATGVENLGHMKAIISAGVNYAQGMFLCSPALQNHLHQWNKENLYEAKRITNMLKDSSTALKDLKSTLQVKKEEFASENHAHPKWEEVPLPKTETTKTIEPQKPAPKQEASEPKPELSFVSSFAEMIKPETVEKAKDFSPPMAEKKDVPQFTFPFISSSNKTEISPPVNETSVASLQIPKVEPAPSVTPKQAVNAPLPIIQEEEEDKPIPKGFGASPIKPKTFGMNRRP